MTDFENIGFTSQKSIDRVVARGTGSVTLTSPDTIARSQVAHGLTRTPLIYGMFSEDRNVYYPLNIYPELVLGAADSQELGLWADQTYVYFGISRLSTPASPITYYFRWVAIWNDL